MICKSKAVGYFNPCIKNKFSNIVYKLAVHSVINLESYHCCGKKFLKLLE